MAGKPRSCLSKKTENLETEISRNISARVCVVIMQWMLKDGTLSAHAQTERRGQDFGMLSVRCGCVGFGQYCKRFRDDSKAFYSILSGQGMS